MSDAARCPPVYHYIITQALRFTFEIVLQVLTLQLRLCVNQAVIKKWPG